MSRLALLSLHTCPVARPGERDTGGMNVYVRNVAAELGRLGNQVDVYTRAHGDGHPAVMDIGENARLVHLRSGPHDAVKDELPEYVPAFRDSLLSFQESDGAEYDMLHSHYWLSAQAGVDLSEGWGVPHSTTFHTLAKKKLRARVGEYAPKARIEAESRAMNRADAILTSTEEEKGDVTRLYGVSDEKVTVIPGGVNLDLFSPGDKETSRRALGIEEPKVILSVGRMELLKGIDILVGALPLMFDLANTRLVVVGGVLGNDREVKRLKAIAQAFGVLDRVTFAGSVDHEDLPLYYNAADVFAMPSYHESFGLAALEAMACGVPVVASRVGGLRTFVTNGVTGYLIPWHCPEPFAQRLEVILNNPALRASMGQVARETAESLGWRRVAASLADVYGGLTGTTWERAAGE